MTGPKLAEKGRSRGFAGLRHQAPDPERWAHAATAPVSPAELAALRQTATFAEALSITRAAAVLQLPSRTAKTARSASTKGRAA